MEKGIDPYGCDTVSSFSWQVYQRYRPQYPAALYNLIFGYMNEHNKDSNTLSLAVDYGTGPGVAIPPLLERGFKKVIGTDLNERQLDEGRALLHKQFPEDRVEMRRGAAGECDFLVESSVDLVIAGEAAHWFDDQRWIKEAARILKPQGTLAFWYYGPTCCILSHPEAVPACQRIFDRYFGGQSRLVNDGVLLRASSKLDSIKIDPMLFEEEERHKFNLPDYINKQVPVHWKSYPSQTWSEQEFKAGALNGNHREIVHQTAPDANSAFLMRTGWTTTDLLEYFKTLGLDMHPLKNSPETEKDLAEIHRIVGGPQGTFDVGWWLSLVVATRRKEDKVHC